MMHAMTATNLSNGAFALAPEWMRWLEITLGEQTLTLDHSRPIQTLAAEASQRKFFRIPVRQSSGGSTRILMHSPPQLENNRAFVDTAAAMHNAGVIVPRIYAHELSEGLMLLSDLGSDHLVDAYADGRLELALDAALLTLANIQTIAPSQIPPYTSQRFSDELDIFVDWLVRDACELALPDAMFEPVRRTLLASASDQAQVCVHRDYHCRNLLLLPDDLGSTEESQVVRVGVVDFQDALFGPISYDLASLLFDCYWEFSPATITEYCGRYLAKNPGVERIHIDLIAIQRQLKAIGIFARLAIRDKKTSHLRYIDPVIRRLSRQSMRYEPTKALSRWLINDLQPAVQTWVGGWHANDTQISTKP